MPFRDLKRRLSRREFVRALPVAVLSPTVAEASPSRDQTGIAQAFLVRSGASAARIFTSEEADERLAASELNHHLRKMSGAALEVIETERAVEVTAPAIVLGPLARQLADGAEIEPPSGEGFRLLTRDGLLLVIAEDGAGVLQGIYRLLEALGCEWVMPGEIGEIVPRRADVPMPVLDIAEAPAFSYRRLWYGGGRDIVTPADKARLEQWLRRQRGGGRSTPPTQTMGHYWGRFIRRHRAEFAADPTMYALCPNGRGGLVRQGPQIETTHPRVIELMVEDIRAEFRRNNWPRDRAAGFPISPADGLGFSVSPESLAAGSGRIDPVNGQRDVTDLVVLLGNSILNALGDDYPNVYLGFYSYSVHSSFPSRYTPHPRLVPIFAPISFSRFHSLLDERSSSQSRYKAVLDQWGALARRQGNRMMFRGYSWNLADNMLPYSKTRIWGEELPYYAALGVEGLNVEGTKTWSVQGPNDWILMKLAWNPRQDWRALLGRYCEKSYGAGAPPMVAYFLRLAETQRSAWQEAGSYHSFPLIYDRAFIAAAGRDFDAARRLAREPDERTRIDYLALSVEALRLYLDYFDATIRFDFDAALRAYEAMHEHWRQSYALNPDLVAKEAPRHLERFIGPFVRLAAERSRGDSAMIESLPDAMPTVLDPDQAGLEQGYHRHPFAVGESIQTRTYSTTWFAQGLDRVRSVWYQHVFRLPDPRSPDLIGLFLGGFDDEARVWLNGRRIGSSGRRFSRPAEFDLTDGIDRTGDNLLAIEVVRNVALNELGTGGLFRPSFLFGSAV